MSGPVAVNHFGGLNVIDDPQEVGLGGAIDGLNFELIDRGRVRVRDGAGKYNSSAGSGTYRCLAPASFSGTNYLLGLAASGTTVYLDRYADGPSAPTAVGNWAASHLGDPVRIGTPTSEVIYIPTSANASTGNVLRRYNGAALATATGSPLYVGLLPGSNRLAQAGFLAAADEPTGNSVGSRSTICFSEPGTPETFTTANNCYVHLQPGDGEYIQAVVNWRDLLFVFKPSTLFIFYGTSTDSAGKPIFNYRTVTLPTPLPKVPIGPAASAQVVAGTDGVYYFTHRGVFKTTGGEPIPISGPVDPIVRGTIGTSSVTYTAGDRMRLGWAGDRLYCVFTNSDRSGDRMLVWDSVLNDWLLWGYTVDKWTAPPVLFHQLLGTGNQPVTFLGSATDVHYWFTGVTTDPGSAAIASSYQSGWAPIGDPRADGTAYIRGINLWGTGSPTLSILADFGTSDTQAAAVTLGTSPTVARGSVNRSYMARLYAFKLAATSGAWSVNSLTLNEYP